MHDQLLQRIEYLEARLAIQDLRHRYWLTIVERDLEAMMACYAPDAHSHFGFAEFKGHDALRSYYQRQMSDPDLAAQVPFGTNGVVTLVDETHATGSWFVSVVHIRKTDEHGTRNNVRYHETYVKIGGDWKISSQRLDFLCFEQITPVRR